VIEDNIYASGARYALKEEDTTFFEAGAITFGVEVRAVNADALRKRLPVEREYVTKLVEAAGLDLETVDYELIFFHILGRDRTHYIRLDYQMGDTTPFQHREAREWHWHYTPPSNDPASPGTYDIPAIRTYYYDRVINGDDIWEWWFSCLESRLPDMLRSAGASELADELDPGRVRTALSAARACVRRCQAAADTRPR
jgi:hypothetical protein